MTRQNETYLKPLLTIHETLAIDEWDISLTPIGLQYLGLTQGPDLGNGTTMEQVGRAFPDESREAV